MIHLLPQKPQDFRHYLARRDDNALDNGGSHFCALLTL